jgi:hypothetical protein
LIVEDVMLVAVGDTFVVDVLEAGTGFPAEAVVPVAVGLVGTVEP